MLHVKKYARGNNYKLFSKLMINHEKRRDDTERFLTNANEILQHVQFNKLLLHHLAKFEFRSIYSLFLSLPLALETR